MRMRNMRLPSPRSSATPPARAPFLETNVCAVCDGLCRPTRARGSSAVGSRGTRSRENWARTQLQLCASSRLYLYTAPSQKRETAAREREREKKRENERKKFTYASCPTTRPFRCTSVQRLPRATSDERRATISASASAYLCTRTKRRAPSLSVRNE